MRPVGNVDGYLYERVDNGLVNDLTPLRVLRARQLLRGNDLQDRSDSDPASEHMAKRVRTVMFRECFVRLDSSSLSLTRSARGLST